MVSTMPSTRVKFLSSHVDTTTNYIITGEYEIIAVDATSGNLTVTFPDATTFAGSKFTIIKVDSSANTVTATAAGSDTISTGAVLYDQHEARTFIPDGTVWRPC